VFRATGRVEVTAAVTAAEHPPASAKRRANTTYRAAPSIQPSLAESRRTAGPEGTVPRRMTSVCYAGIMPARSVVPEPPEPAPWPELEPVAITGQRSSDRWASGLLLGPAVVRPLRWPHEGAEA
jgi:hypothetical protein